MDATGLWWKNLTERTFFLDQHGCAKNQVDGELLISRLESIGLAQTTDPSEAQYIIINSCGFIESAKQESLDALLSARGAYPEAKLVLAGCLAQRYADVFKTELPEADAVFGNGDITRIDQVIEALGNGERPVVTPPQQGVCSGGRKLLSCAGSAYVKITEGCNNCCSFCAIPLIRGQLRSRSVHDVVSEVRELVSSGVREINIIGQDLAAYGCGKNDDVLGTRQNGYSRLYTELTAPLFTNETLFFEPPSFLHELLKAISAVHGDFWVRLLYIHPDHFHPDVLSVLKDDSRFLPYFDIPFQSGADSVITAMNRKGSFKSYVDLVQHIRSVFPHAAIRTTFLTGFPGETDADAAETEEFLKAIQSDWSGCFSYSKEEGTAAFRMKGSVPKKVAAARAFALQSVQQDITRNRLAERVGSVYDVLIEEIVAGGSSDEGLAIGRAWFDAPEVDGNFVVRYDRDDPAACAIVPGAIVKAKAIASSDVDIDGVFCAK